MEEQESYNCGRILEETVILADPSTSFWLRQAIKDTRHRDPVDSLNDAELLVKILRLRCAVGSG